jgi:hypothetical protein
MQIYLQAPLPLLVFRRRDAEMLFEASAKKVVPTVHYYPKSAKEILQPNA